MNNQLSFFDSDNFANSSNSYRSTEVQDNIPTQKEKVLEAIKTLKIASDRDISKYTGISLSLIPARRGRLLKDNKIEKWGIAIDNFTNKKVTCYKIKQ